MGNSRIESICTLRVLAGIFVVILHTIGLAQKSGYNTPPAFGSFGTDILFIISGFVIVISTKNTASRGHFLYKRFLKIVPNYWIITSVKVALMVAMPAACALKLDWAHVASSYALLPWKDQAGIVEPIIYVGWTLTYELILYAIFALTRFNVNYTSIIFAVLAISGLAKGSVAWATITNPLLLEFSMGMAIGCIYQKKPWLLPAVCACIVLVFPGDRACFHGLPSAMLVLSCISVERYWPKLSFNWLLDSSYTRYLTQVFTLPVYFKAISYFSVLPSFIAITGAVVSVTLVGYLTHIAVEIPLNKKRPFHLIIKRCNLLFCNYIGRPSLDGRNNFRISFNQPTDLGRAS